ncbi:MAG: glycosyltransferase family 9 protein [Verrucomicrobia bacterium]|nr:glycosyltransferase family 9 protein [Verrucomicrobiota bacterium]
MSYKNTFLRLLSRIAAPSRTQQNRILAVATTALGDTLWAMPAIESLRKSFPNSHIALLTSPIGLQIFKHNPWTDEIHLLDSPLALWKKLRGRFDTILILHASQRFILPLCASLGATRIVGTAGINKDLDDLLTDPLPNLPQHEIDRRLAMVEAIGGRAHSKTLSFFLQPEEKKPLSGRWIAIHPGAKDSYKLWPLSHFAAVGRALKNYNILITGGPSERPLMEELSRLIPNSHLADSSLSLRSFAGLLSSVDLLICNDSGPFHLATALKTPALAIYSPTDPALCGPHHSTTSHVLSKPRTCTPCIRRRCRTPFCLLQIGPDEVIAKSKTILLK